MGEGGEKPRHGWPPRGTFLPCPAARYCCEHRWGQVPDLNRAERSSAWGEMSLRHTRGLPQTRRPPTLPATCHRGWSHVPASHAPMSPSPVAVFPEDMGLSHPKKRGCSLPKPQPSQPLGQQGTVGRESPGTRDAREGDRGQHRPLGMEVQIFYAPRGWARLKDQDCSVGGGPTQA